MATTASDPARFSLGGASERAPGALEGAYASLDDLLALRHWRLRQRRLQARTRRTGGHESRLRGRGIDLDEVREYQAGDDARYIDWRVTARKAHAHTRVFREEREQPTLIVVDQTRSMFFGSVVRLKSVAAAEIAAVEAWRTLAGNDRVGGVVMGDDELQAFRPHRSSAAVGRFLAAVARANHRLSAAPPRAPSAANALPRTLASLVSSNRRIVVISDFIDTGPWLDAVTALAAHHTLSFVFVFDPLERTLPDRGAYTVTDGRRRVRFDAASAGAAYRGRFERRLEEVASHCRDAGITLTTVATSEPVS